MRCKFTHIFIYTYTNMTSNTISNNFILGTMNINYKYTSNKDTSIQNYSNIIETYIQNCKANNEKPILDTAYYYGNTTTEQILGDILTNNSLSLIPKIATKANPWLNNDFTNGILGQLSKDGIEYQLKTSLKNLQMDKIDIFYLHCPDHETSIHDTLEACNTLWRKDKFNYLGISNYSKEQLTEICSICESTGYIIPTYYQGMYNLICRKVEEIFPLLDEYNIEFWGYNPLAGGLLTSKYGKSNASSLSTASATRFNGNAIYQNIFWKEPIITHLTDNFFIHKQSCCEYSFQWLSQFSKMRKNDKIIIGASTVEQCIENMKYIQYPILDYSHDIINKLNNIYTDIEIWSPNYYY